MNYLGSPVAITGNQGTTLSPAEESTASSSSNTLVIVIVVVVALILVIVIAGLVIRHRRNQSSGTYEIDEASNPESYQDDEATYHHTGESGNYEDDPAAARLTGVTSTANYGTDEKA